MADILAILPSRVLPDLVLRTQENTYICIVCYPAGEADYFRRREEKYRDCKNFFTFIIITLNERQWRSALKALKENCAYLTENEELHKSDTYLIFRLSEIDQIPNII